MPRDTESIRHPLHERITETTLWVVSVAGMYGMYIPIFVPAGRNRGRFADKQALLRVLRKILEERSSNGCGARARATITV